MRSSHDRKIPPVGADRPISVDEGVLGRIGGLIGVAQEAPGQAVAGALVVLHELRERRSVAGGGPSNHRHLVWKWRRAMRWVSSRGHRPSAFYNDGSPSPEWRNRQTRRSQTPMSASSCEFKSHLRHHLNLSDRDRGSHDAPGPSTQDRAVWRSGVSAGQRDDPAMVGDGGVPHQQPWDGRYGRSGSHGFDMPLLIECPSRGRCSAPRCGTRDAQ